MHLRQLCLVVVFGLAFRHSLCIAITTRATHLVNKKSKLDIEPTNAQIIQQSIGKALYFTDNHVGLNVLPLGRILCTCVISATNLDTKPNRLEWH